MSIIIIYNWLKKYLKSFCGKKENFIKCIFFFVVDDSTNIKYSLFNNFLKTYNMTSIKISKNLQGILLKTILSKKINFTRFSIYCCFSKSFTPSKLKHLCNSIVSYSNFNIYKKFIFNLKDHSSKQLYKNFNNLYIPNKHNKFNFVYFFLVGFLYLNFIDNRLFLINRKNIKSYLKWLNKIKENKYLFKNYYINKFLLNRYLILYNIQKLQKKNIYIYIYNMNILKLMHLLRKC